MKYNIKLLMNQLEYQFAFKYKMNLIIKPALGLLLADGTPTVGGGKTF